jgi:hypothetical protein
MLKQMRPGPATRAALLSRIFCLLLSPWAKEHRVPALVRAHNPTMLPEACASGFRFGASILPWKGGFLRRPQRPGTSSRE